MKELKRHEAGHLGIPGIVEAAAAEFRTTSSVETVTGRASDFAFTSLIADGTH